MRGERTSPTPLNRLPCSAEDEDMRGLSAVKGLSHRRELVGSVWRADRVSGVGCLVEYEKQGMRGRANAVPGFEETVGVHICVQRWLVRTTDSLVLLIRERVHSA
jgi:hypothetical protein